MSGYQGYHAFPHTVMGLGIKAPVAADCAASLDDLVRRYDDWCRGAESGLSLVEKLRRLASQFYRSKGERRQVADYYAAALQIDLGATSAPNWERESPIHTAA